MPLPLYYNTFFERDSLLSADSLLFRPMVCEPGDASGIGVHHLPDTLRRNDVVGLIIMSGLLLLLLVLGQGKRLFRQMATRFFLPTNNQQTQSTQETFGDHVLRFVLYLLLVVGLTLLGYLFISHQVDVESLMVNTYELLLILFVLAAAFMTLKWAMYRLVHWTFFSREQCQSWQQHASFLFSLEGLLVFPLVTLFVFLNLPLQWLAFSLTFVLLFVKFLLSLKVRSIFFPRIGGTFHLFVYLCALEITPYLVLWATTMAVTAELAPHYLG